MNLFEWWARYKLECEERRQSWERFEKHEALLNERVAACKAALDAGLEVMPPWVVFPHSWPYHGWNQGTNEYYMGDLWNPYWEELTLEQRIAYLKRPGIPEDWLEYLSEERILMRCLDEESVLWRERFKPIVFRDRARLTNGEEILPPWLIVPDLTPKLIPQHYWVWHWNRYIWENYYQLLDDVACADYQRRYPVPELWRETVLYFYEFDAANRAYRKTKRRRRK